jgi:hypothetical protein
MTCEVCKAAEFQIAVDAEIARLRAEAPINTHQPKDYVNMTQKEYAHSQQGRLVTKTPKELAEAHWDGYVGPMMKVMMKAAVEMSRFHYVSSHIHGTKHGTEDRRE